jgi:hypothetical protein
MIFTMTVFFFNLGSKLVTILVDLRLMSECVDWVFRRVSIVKAIEIFKGLFDYLRLVNHFMV